MSESGLTGLRELSRFVSVSQVGHRVSCGARMYVGGLHDLRIEDLTVEEEVTTLF